MADAAPVRYTRLPGRGNSRKRGSFLGIGRTSCRLWLGDDHLLQVESAGGYSESYKRFRFRDIQAISLYRTKTWEGATAVLGILTALFLFFTVAVKGTGGRVALGIFAAAFGVPLLVNVLLGPTCACHLRTAVHLEELPSLRRRRRAERVLARLRPLIEAAQGSASAETLAPEYAALLANANAAPAEARQAAETTTRETVVRPYRSRAHRILFVALLAEAVVDALEIVWHGQLAILVGMIAGSVSAGGVVVALVKQHQTDLKVSVRTLTWAVAGFVGLQRAASYIVLLVMTQSQRLDGTEWGYIKGLAEMRPLETPWLLALLSSSAGLAALLGAAGLLLLPRRADPA